MMRLFIGQRLHCSCCVGGWPALHFRSEQSSISCSCSAPWSCCSASGRRSLTAGWIWNSCSGVSCRKSCWKAMQRQNCRKFRHRKDLMMRNAFALSSALPALAKAKRHRNANDWIITLPVLKHSCTRRSRKRHPGKAYRAGLALQPVRWQH